MNTFVSKKPLAFNRLFFSILQKLTQRADFYPIKYYHRKKRNRDGLQSL